MADIANTPGTETGNQVIGKVSILYGTVKAISPDGTVRILDLNSPVYADDRIITESDGNLSIVLDDPAQTQLDIGRMSDIILDEDVYGGVTPEDVAEAAAEIEEIQQALLAGAEGDLDMEATAAGGVAAAGGGHPTFVVDPTGEEVIAGTPGPETTGVIPGTVDPLEGTPGEPAPPVVEPPDTAPVANPDTNTVVEGSEDLVVNAANGILANDVDSADGGTVVTTTSAMTGSLGGSLTIASDGSYVYTPPASVDHDDAVPDSETFDYTIQDANGTESSSTLTINIADTAPVAIANEDEVTEGAEGYITGNLITDDTGGSQDIPLTLLSVNGTDVVGSTSWTVVYSGAEGVLEAKSNGEYQFAVADSVQNVANAPLELEVGYTMKDADGSEDDSTLTISIGDTFPEAVANEDEVTEGAEGYITGNLITDDTGGSQDIPLTLLSVNGTDVVGSTSWTVVYSGAEGVLEAKSNGEYQFAVADSVQNVANAPLELEVGYTMKDADGSEDDSTLTISIADIAPTVDPLDTIIANEIDNSTPDGVDLGIDFGPDGAAESGAISLVSNPANLNASGYIIGSNLEPLTANEMNLIYQPDPDGTGGLEAVAVNENGQVYVDADGNNHVAFKVSLDVTGETYSVTIVDGLDGAAWSTTVGFTSDTDGITGGNTLNVNIPVDLSGDGSIDTDISITGVNLTDHSSFKVNYNSNGMGVSGGSKINDNEALHVEFLNLDGTHKLISNADATTWHLDSNEIGSWTAFKHVWTDTNNNGVIDDGEIEMEQVGVTTPFTSSTVHIDPEGSFDTIEFTEAGGNGYGVSAITIQDTAPGVDHTVSFDVTVTDSDGSVSELSTFDVAFDADGDITGTDAAEVIVGSSGDDIISGGGGDDIIYGGAGNDTLTGKLGADTLTGGAGDDTLKGGGGADTFVTGDDNDTIKDYSQAQDDLVDISDVFVAGDDTLTVENSTGGADGKAKLVITQDSPSAVKGSITFDNIDYNDSLTPEENLESLLGQVDIDYDGDGEIG